MWVWAVNYSVPPILDSGPDIVWGQRPPSLPLPVALEMRSQLEGHALDTWCTGI